MMVEQLAEKKTCDHCELPEEREMIDVKEAVKNAREFFGSLCTNADLAQVRLEEVELSDDESLWMITLSYPNFESWDPLPTRSYRLFTIDANSGRVISMKIRQLT